MRALSDLSDEQVEIAFLRFERESSEFPTISAIRRYSGAGGASDEDRARIAWAAVMETVRKHGGYTSVEFDDPLIHAVIRLMGGWSQFGVWETDETKWKAREFITLYEMVSRTGAGDGTPLIGIHDSVNKSNGHLDRIEPPVKIVTGLPAHPMARRLAAPVDRHQQNALSQAAASALPDFSADR